MTRLPNMQQAAVEDDVAGDTMPADAPTKRPPARRRRALLSSEGYGDRRFTPHRYVRTEWRRWQYPAGSDDPPGVGKPRLVQAFIWACEETGEERIYGCE